MDRGKSAVPRLILPLTEEESARRRVILQYFPVMKSTRRVCTRRNWKTTWQQKQILESVWATGTRKPSEAQIAQFTAQLRRYGLIEAKNVLYWFQNANARDKRKKEQSPATTPKSPAQSNKLEDKISVEEQEEVVKRTLELFPLHPDRGGLL